MTTKKLMEAKDASLKVLRMYEVAAKVNLAPSTIYELQSVNPPKFPRSFKIVPGGRAAGWFESDIDNWLANREEDNNA